MDEFTYGELIILEMNLVEKIKETDLSMHSGQFLTGLLGKIEYKLGQLASSAKEQMPLQPVGPETINAGPK